MINPNKTLYANGHIIAIEKHTSMTVIKVWIDGSQFEHVDFNYRRRFRVNDNVMCRLKFSILNDGLIIEKLNKYYTKEERDYKRMMGRIKAIRLTKSLIG